ncbi:MAG: hypothetical protein RLO01_02745 [Thalassobaculaceae bacterium]
MTDHQHHRKSSLLSFVPAAVAGAAMLVAATVGGLAPDEDGTGPVAAVFPPWWSAHDVMAGLARTDAAILREGFNSSIVLASSPAPGLADRLRAAGALLVLDPQAAAGCLGIAPPALRG